MKTMSQKYKDGEISRKEYGDYTVQRKGYKDYNEYINELNHLTGKCESMLDNKKCSMFLGVYVAERVLAKIWDNVIRMPNGNRGFDFICGRGFKVDVKSSCIYEFERLSNNGYVIHDGYNFRIKKNKIADYFLFITFDNRKDLNPQHIWLIKGTEIINKSRLNEKISLTIFVSQIEKYKKYEQFDKFEKMIICCNKLK